jgi:hypothetical protein
MISEPALVESWKVHELLQKLAKLFKEREHAGAPWTKFNYIEDRRNRHIIVLVNIRSYSGVYLIDHGGEQYRADFDGEKYKTYDVHGGTYKFPITVELFEEAFRDPEFSRVVFETIMAGLEQERALGPKERA